MATAGVVGGGEKEKDLELGGSPTRRLEPVGAADGDGGGKNVDGGDGKGEGKGTSPSSAPPPPPLGRDHFMVAGTAADGSRHTADDTHHTSADDPRYMVTWAVNDPDNPQNWSLLYKSWVTLQLSMLALAASVASSMIAPAGGVVAAQIGVGENVVVLNVSLFV
jgi:hypothetical protein